MTVHVGPDRLGGISSSFQVHGKKDCTRFPMNGECCIKIRDTHVQTEISLMFLEIPNK